MQRRSAGTRATAPSAAELDPIALSPLGFMLLSDLGAQTMMQVIAPPADVQAIAVPTEAQHALYMQAVEVLIRWQRASKPGVLPPYDDALLSRELALFPEWYVKQHRGIALEA